MLFPIFTFFYPASPTVTLSLNNKMQNHIRFELTWKTDKEQRIKKLIYRYLNNPIKISVTISKQESTSNTEKGKCTWQNFNKHFIYCVEINKLLQEK